MIITSLKAPSFKGHDIAYSFTAANLISGDPFGGKTGITQALQIAMYGFVPGLGTGNESVFEFAFSGDLFAKIVFSSGEENIVTISKTGERLSKDSKLAHKFPEVLMNLEEYLSKTEQGRLQYVLDRVDVKKAGYDEKKLLKELFGEKPASSAEEKAQLSWSKSFDESIGQRERTSSSVPFWMESLVVRLKSKTKSLKQSVIQRESSIKLLDKPEVKDVSKEREAAHKKLSEVLALGGALGGLDMTDGQIKESDRRTTDLKDRIGRLEAEELRVTKLTHCPTCKNKGKDWLKEWRKEHDAKLTELTKELRDERKENARLIVERKKLAEELDADEHQKKLDEVQSAYDALDSAHISRSTWEAQQGQLKQERELLEIERAEQTVVKRLTEKLVEYQQKLVDKSIISLLQTANVFTNGLMRTPLAYHQGEIGRWESKQWVPARVGLFSGTEHLIAFAGLQVALSQEAPCKIVILDELGRMPVAWKRKVTERMLSLVKQGVIDQWIGVDCESAWLTGQLEKAVNLIKL